MRVTDPNTFSRTDLRKVDYHGRTFRFPSEKGPSVIIDNKSTQRFVKLFSSFLKYANERLGVTDKLFDRYGRMYDEDAYDVAMKVWADDESPAIVSDYVRDNPDKLSRTDLREIAQWEHAIAGIFVVRRDGRDVLFYLPGYAIAVRGFAQEIDSVLDDGTPAIVETVLLPFGNVVVYSLALTDTPMPPREDILADLDAIKASSRTIRSARDFVRNADALSSATLKAEDIYGLDEDEFDEDELLGGYGADDEVEGQHRGPLAGLRGRERLNERDRMDDEDHDSLVEVAFRFRSTFARPETPPTNVRELLALSSDDHLARLAQAFGVEGDISSMDRQALVDAVASHQAFTTEDVLFALRNRGLSALRFARELQEAGGQIELTLEDALERGEVAPATPIVFDYYRKDTTLVAAMIDEFVSLLSDVDWDVETERTRRLEDARHFLSVLTELRGVDVLEEAWQEYLDYVGDPDQAVDIESFADMCWNDGKAGYADFAAFDVDGTTMLVDTYFRDFENDGMDEPAIRRIIELQADKPKRPLTPEMLQERDFSDYLLMIDEVQDLVGYLDEHVPDTQSDLGFADDLTTYALLSTQIPTPEHDLKPCLASFDFFTTKAQVERFMDLVTEAGNNRPYWANRGWTPNQMREMIDSGAWVPVADRA